MLAAEEIEKRMAKAIRDGIITAVIPELQITQALNGALINQTEATLLRKAQTARAEVIAVDSFSAKSMAQENIAS